MAHKKKPMLKSGSVKKHLAEDIKETKKGLKEEKEEISRAKMGIKKDSKLLKKLGK